jgi:hypothetical protein
VLRNRGCRNADRVEDSHARRHLPEAPRIQPAYRPGSSGASRNPREKGEAEDIQRYAEYFEEIRTSVSGYLTSIVSDQEGREAGRLFAKRRRQEMAEDPMHGGWLEEEREKKKRKELRKARRSRKESTNKTNRTS